MDFEKREKLYKRALDKWGEPLQMIMAIEEMSELTKEITKRFRGEEGLDKIIDEVADVKIMMEQIEFMLKIEDLVKVRIQEKSHRLEKFLNKLDEEQNENS